MSNIDIQVPGDKYVAIYARKSSKNDSTSLESQISGCKELAKENSLLIYSIYEDKISAKTFKTTERPGFKKLLIEAKKGCFKTIIIFRYDRLVRRYDDWISISNKLKQLGVKILLTDTSQPSLNGNMETEFLVNLIVLFADIEPDNIAMRSRMGLENTRLKGRYYSKGSPFGYIKIKDEFEIKPVYKEVIQYCFNIEFESLNKNNNSDKHNNDSIKKLTFIMEIILNSLILGENLENINTGQYIKELNEHDKELIMRLSEYPKKQINQSLNEIKKEWSIKNKITNRSRGELNKIFSKAIYGGYMIVKLGGDKTLRGLTKEVGSEKKYYLDWSKYSRTTNIQGIIEEEVFKKVYETHKIEGISRFEASDKFILKGKIYCGNCKKVMYIKDDFFQCDKLCNIFLWKEIERYLLEEISRVMLNHTKNGLNKFLGKLKGKSGAISERIKYMEKREIKELNGYILENQQFENIDSANEFIANIKAEIKVLKDKRSLCEIKIEAIDKCINNNRKSRNSDLSKLVEN